jgi:hypothetical protein
VNDDIAYTFNLLRKPVRWRALRDRTAPMSGWASSLDELESIAAASTRGWDVYVGLNPVNRNVRPLASNVSAWEWLLVDLDPVRGSEPDLLASVYSTVGHIQRLTETKLTPEWIYTGNGTHLWLHIDQDISLDPGAIAAASKAFLRAIDPGDPQIKVDPSTSDLARLARLPGTVNQRTGRWSKFLQRGGGRGTVKASTIMRFLPNAYAPADPQQIAATWREAWSHLTNRAQSFLDAGAGQGSRHESLWHAARKLFELGVSETSAKEALDYAAEQCQPPLAPADVNRVLREEWHKERYALSERSEAPPQGGDTGIG